MNLRALLSPILLQLLVRLTIVPRNIYSLIIDIWRSMISGPPIDEQRAMRMAIKNPRIDTPSTDEELGAPADVDSDADPNDIIQKPMTSAAGDPDSDSDNGESDSD